MTQGTVVFASTRGYGFLEVDSTGENLYWHISDVEGRQLLREGDRVAFEIAAKPARDGNKRQAIRVKRLIPPQTAGGERQ